MAEEKTDNPLASILSKAQEALGGSNDASKGVDLSSLGLGNLNLGNLEELLKSDKVEGISDKLLDALETAAKNASPDKKAAIESIRDQLDRKVGNE